MSINKTKLYIGYYFSYILVTMFFIVVLMKGIWEAFFNTLKETIDMIKEAHLAFERRKTFRDNQ